MRERNLFFSFVVLGLIVVVYIMVSYGSYILPCGIENCHGLEIECGQNLPGACTEIYLLGDGCRRYASCAVIEGACVLENNNAFQECRACVESCMNTFPGSDHDNADNLMDCESNCMNWD